MNQKNILSRAVVEVLEQRRLLTGGYAWVDQIGGTGTDVANDVQFRPKDGTVVVVGSFSGTVDFDPRADRTTNLTSAGGTDAFVARYEANGNLIWAKQIGGSGDDTATAVAYSPARIGGVTETGDTEIVLTGSFSGTVDINPAPDAVKTLTSAGSTDAFMLQLFVSGKFVRAEREGGAGADEGRSLRVDWEAIERPNTRDEYEYALRTTISGVSFGVLPGRPAPSDNHFQWAIRRDSQEYRVFDNSSANVGDGDYRVTGGITATEKGGQPRQYVIGQFSGTVTFGAFYGQKTRTSVGGTDAFILELGLGNNFAKNVVTFGGPGDDTIDNIVAGDSEALYVTGTFSGTADLDPAGTHNFTTRGGTDAFLAKFGFNLQYDYARQFGGAGDEWINGLAVDATERNIMIAGSFTGTPDFNPDPFAVANRTSRGTDGFVAKITQLATDYEDVNTIGAPGVSVRTEAVDTDRAGNRYTLLAFVGTADIDYTRGGTRLATLTSSSDRLLVKYTPRNQVEWARAITFDPAADGIDSTRFARFEVTPADELDVTLDGRAIVGYNVKAIPTSGSATYYAVLRAVDAKGNDLDRRALGGTGTVMTFGALEYNTYNGAVVGGRYGNGGYYARYDPGFSRAARITTGFADEFTAFARVGQFALGRSVHGPKIPTLYLINQAQVSARIQVTGPAGQSVGEATSLVYDDATGNVIIGGTVTNPVNDFDPNPNSTKTLPVGNFLWSVFPFEPSRPIPFTATPTYGSNVTMDGAGNIYVAGTFSGAVDANPAAGTGSSNVWNVTSKGGTDVLVQKFSRTHQLISAGTFGGTGNDSVTGLSTYGGNLYVYGGYRGTVDFDPGRSTVNRSAKGDEDAYMLRLLL